MKIKKKELRKREAQLPINYPDPTVLPEAVPGGVIDLEKELVQIECLCKRLAHNEVAVRDAVLAEIPAYLRKVTAHLPAVEAKVQRDVDKLAQFYATHPRADKLYHYDNLFRALHEFHSKSVKKERESRRQTALRELRQRRAEERHANERYGKYDEEDKHENSEQEYNKINKKYQKKETESTASSQLHVNDEQERNASHINSAEQRMRYGEWLNAWSEMELIFLKLSRGLHFCLWHSDKPLVQLECADKIALLVHSPMTVHGQLLFYGALFRVLAREWPTIDRYRLDKYLALVRRMIFTLCKLFKTNENSEEDVELSHAVFTVTSETTNHDNTQSGEYDNISDVTINADNNNGKKKTDANTVDSIVRMSINEKYKRKPILQQSLNELAFLFHTHIFPSLTSTGLTMHICDVVFDELNRAFLSPSLFITLSVILPLYAMSQGNFVEKRVLDHFFPPLVGGSLSSRRVKQWTLQLTKMQRLLEKKEATQKGMKCKQQAIAEANKSEHIPIANNISSTSDNNSKNDQSFSVNINNEILSKSTSEAEIATLAKTTAQNDYMTITSAIMEACKRFAVARGTVHAVRVMFSEAQLVLYQSLHPNTFAPLSEHAQEQQIRHEIEEINEITQRVRQERSAVRALKRQREEQEGYESENENDEVNDRRNVDDSVTSKKKIKRAQRMKKKKSKLEEETKQQKKQKSTTIKEKKGKNGECPTTATNERFDDKVDGQAKVTKTTKRKDKKKLTHKRKQVLTAKKEMSKKSKPAQKVKKNTKRKKYYTLTRDDLYGSSDDDVNNNNKKEDKQH